MASRLLPEFEKETPSYLESRVRQFEKDFKNLDSYSTCNEEQVKTILKQYQPTISDTALAYISKDVPWLIKAKQHIIAWKEVQESLNPKDHQVLATKFRLMTWMFSSNGQISSQEWTEKFLEAFKKTHELPSSTYSSEFWSKMLDTFLHEDRKEMDELHVPEASCYVWGNTKMAPLSEKDAVRFMNSLSSNAAYYLSKISETRVLYQYGYKYGTPQETSECIFWDGLMKKNPDGSYIAYFRRRFKNNDLTKSKYTEIMVRPEEYLFNAFCENLPPKHRLVKTCDSPGCINPLHHVMENTRKRQREDPSLVERARELIESREEWLWMIEFLDKELSSEKKHSLEKLGSVNPELYAFITRTLRDMKMSYK